MLAPSIIFVPLPVSEYLAVFNDLFMALDLLWSQLLGEHIISLATPNTLNTPFIGFCTMKLPYKGKLSNSVCMAHLFKLSKTTSESAILTWDIYSTSAPQIFVVVVSLTSTIATRPTGPTFYVSPPSLIMTSTCIFVGNLFFKDAGIPPIDDCKKLPCCGQTCICARQLSRNSGQPILPHKLPGLSNRSHYALKRFDWYTEGKGKRARYEEEEDDKQEGPSKSSSQITECTILESLTIQLSNLYHLNLPSCALSLHRSRFLS